LLYKVTNLYLSLVI